MESFVNIMSPIPLRLLTFKSKHTALWRNDRSFQVALNGYVHLESARKNLATEFFSTAIFLHM